MNVAAPVSGWLPTVRVPCTIQAGHAPVKTQLLAKHLLTCHPCYLVVRAAQEVLHANSRLAAGMSHQHHHQPRGKERSLKGAVGLAAASPAVHQVAYHPADAAASTPTTEAERPYDMTSAVVTLRHPNHGRRLQADSVRGNSLGGRTSSDSRAGRSSSTRGSMRNTSGGDEYGGTGGAVGGGAGEDGVGGGGGGGGVRRGMEAALRLLESRAYAELPPPLAGPGTNWESDHATCYINQELQVRVGRQLPQGAHQRKHLLAAP